MPIAYALIHQEAGASGISFPDFPGVVASAATPEMAIQRGSAVLSFHVAGMVADGDHLPMLRTIDELMGDPSFAEDAEGGVIALVPFDLPAKSVRVNISLDEHLLASVDKAAAAEGMSRSGFIAEAAKRMIRAA